MKICYSPFFCVKFLLPPENLQRKETKLVLFCTHFVRLKGLCPIRVMSNFDFINPGR